jgi:predicted kinase
MNGRKKENLYPCTKLQEDLVVERNGRISSAMMYGRKKENVAGRPGNEWKEKVYAMMYRRRKENVEEGA